jgi:DNA-directed RNA polymerase subunit H (RpoH/RPB5)
MEDRALETLQTMLARRGLDTKVDRLATEDVERANLYTIGDILVVFSQKDRGILDRDITKFIDFAGTNGYKNGIIIVSLTPLSENVLKVAKSYSKDKVQFFHIRQLQFDITTHRLAVPHRILKEDERTAVFEKFKITKPDQLPSIDSQDPMAKWIGAVPGDIIEVLRHSDVAGQQLYYRHCVEDVNVA